jgi:chaperonin cofactor prefoldin
MNRLARPDATLDALNEEREHLAIQISLLDDSETPDQARLAALRDKLILQERRISKYKPGDA